MDPVNTRDQDLIEATKALAPPQPQVSLVTSDFAARATDDLLQVDPSGATTKVTITLPDATKSAGARITIKIGVAALNGKYVEVVPKAGQTFDGNLPASPFILNASWAFAVARCDGTQWLTTGVSADGAAF